MICQNNTLSLQQCTYRTGPPATTVPSTMPQLRQPVTKVSSKAARMYAKPAYRVHITRARLDNWRCRSFLAVALLIFPVRSFSAFSNEAASSLDCERVSSFPRKPNFFAYPERPKGDHDVEKCIGQPRSGAQSSVWRDGQRSMLACRK